MAKFSIQAIKGLTGNADVYEDEPVSVAQLKEYLQIEGSAYDATLANFISASRMMIERYCNVSLVPHVLRVQMRNTVERKAFPLPYPPIVSVEAVYWKKCPSTNVELIAATEWWMVDDQADDIELESVKAGLFFIDYTTAAATEPVWQQAILAQCGYMYNNRDSDKKVKLASETEALIQEFRKHYY